MTEDMHKFIQLYGLDKLEGVNEIQCYKFFECIGKHLPRIRGACSVSSDAVICEIGDVQARLKYLINPKDLMNISNYIKCTLPPKPLDDNVMDFVIFRDIIDGLV